MLGAIRSYAETLGHLWTALGMIPHFVFDSVNHRVNFYILVRKRPRLIFWYTDGQWLQKYLLKRLSPLALNWLRTFVRDRYLVVLFLDCFFLINVSIFLSIEVVTFQASDYWWGSRVLAKLSILSKVIQQQMIERDLTLGEGCPVPSTVLVWEVALALEIILVILFLLKMLTFKECLMSVLSRA